MPRPIIYPIICACCHVEFRGSEMQRYTYRRGRAVYHSPECRKAARPTLAERFWANVRRLDNGCLEWIGLIDKKGYGVMRAFGKMRKAHHVAWFLRYDCWPPSILETDHTCHHPHGPNKCLGGITCPHRRCVEFGHLKLVPAHTENSSAERSVAGMILGAINATKTICKNGHKLTPENTYIRPDGKGRQCKECAAERSRRQKRH